ncbi:uncharacterized protein LOC142225059 [Haematobia irritans]|uniref:uncharacterized protein LOC142225059 n=1 Tax=Haematobia irritans TaxID=7368 RepID=UPI003F5036DB
MNIFTLLAIGSCILGLTWAFEEPLPARYDDFKVYKVFIEDAQQLDEVKKLASKLPVRFLNDMSISGRSYDIAIDPYHQEALESQFKYLELKFECFIHDLQA